MEQSPTTTELRRLRLSGPGAAPFVVAWSGEKAAAPSVIATRRGIAYADEALHDRDTAGVLWTRYGVAQGLGEPLYGTVHPLRQRRAMRRGLCQMCAGPPDLDEAGVLWLLDDGRGSRPDWPEGEVTTHPPVCLPCARRAVRACPHPRAGYAAVCVRHFIPDGVYGTLFRLRGGRLEAGKDAVTLYGDPANAWMLAGQQTATLTGCTVVDLAESEGARAA
ncbi:hypothetical protein ACFXP3_27375 [Streptomyces sp. NPDC059096]|uniref:hypothetical protein n=1 Tax=Streptomyces sp. NPDC059096 TaxID=3346727 RepID=UPI0036B41413